MSIAKVLARGQITLPREVRRLAGIKPGDAIDIQVIGPGQVRFSLLPKLNPRELRDRYPIHVDIDESKDRAAWQAQAAKDVLGKTP
jgi:AbrB family looped-hinge helix DNA binding protein